MQEIPEKVQIFRVIGHGLTSQVMECKINTKHYAMKVFKANVESHSKQNEIFILNQLSHPNIIDIYKYDPCENPDWFITELYQEKDLFDYIAIIKQPFEDTISQYIFRRLVSAVSHIHEKGMVHRDLKLENILLDPISNQIKICDFGFAQNISQYGQRSLGTTGYMAPELFHYEHKSCLTKGIKGEDIIKTDIFGLGVILFIMVSGFPPFTSANIQDGCPLWRAIDGLRWPLFWKSVFRRGRVISDELKDLLQGMLNSDADTRYSMELINQNKWYQLDEISEAQYMDEMNRRKNLV